MRSRDSFAISLPSFCPRTIYLAPTERRALLSERLVQAMEMRENYDPGLGMENSCLGVVEPTFSYICFQNEGSLLQEK